MEEEFVTPEGFWKLYAGKLNAKELNNDKKKETIEAYRKAYRNDSKWTEIIIAIVTEMIGSEMKLKTQNEYFRTDVTGYTTEWEEEKKIAQQRKKYEGIKMHPLHNWKLKVAYEHENSDGWSDELCKLCHITADLKVISSYYGSNKDDIEKTLKYYIERLDSEGTMRRAEGQWLFVFGPRKNSGDLFKAFTLDDDMNVIPLEAIKMPFLSSNS